MVGLRRHEINLLPWAAFRWDEEVIRIQATEHFRRSLMSRKATSRLIESCSQYSEAPTPAAEVSS
jgi:hypothetical protein